MPKRILLPLCFFFLTSLCAQTGFNTGQSAELMVSGVDFNNTGGPLAFNHPNGLATDGTHFLLCDRFNNRVLVWNTLPSSWDDTPDLVLGQPDFTSNDPGTGKHQLNWAGNVSVGANGKLAIADTENDRILIWNTFPATSGTPADVTLFLPAISPAGSPLIYGWPWGVWTDGQRLAAVATTGGAILFWDSLPTVDNEPPSYVVKLPQFGTPRNISTDGSSYFFVGDHNAKVNNKPGTFFWNSYPTVTDQPYDFYRDEWIKGEKLPDGKLLASGILSYYLWNTMPTQADHHPDLTFSPPFYKNGDGVDVAVAGGKIFLNNYNGNDVLVYNTVPNSANQMPDFALGASSISAQTLDSINYVQNPVPASDGTRLIVSSDFDRAIYVWNQFPTQSGQPYDHRIALPQNVQVWANALYANRFAVAARNTVSIWNNAAQLSNVPSVIFNNHIGTAALNDLTGVALDSQFFYLATKNGTIYIWDGIPDNADTNPLLVIPNNGTLGFLHSNGEFLCAARPEPPSGIDVYRVADLALGIATPYKTINAVPQGPINQASHAIVFGETLAMTSRGNHCVLLWEKLADWGDFSKMVVLGQPNTTSKDAAIGIDHLFMPNALLSHAQELWVGEFKFSSRILKFSSEKQTAIQEPLAVERHVKVFPNPVGAVINFEMEPSYSDNYTIELLGGDGRVLKTLFSEKLKEGVLFQTTFSAQACGLPQGISFLKIRSSKSRVVLKVIY